MNITLLNIKLKIENNMKDCYLCTTENILKDKLILYEKKITMLSCVSFLVGMSLKIISFKIFL